jgi:hypothetical protein
MNINYRKIAKIITLLLSSLLIATVSAQMYRYMYIDGSITPSGARMIWIKGAEAPTDTTISGSTVQLDLDVEEGTPADFSDVLYLKNVNTSGSFNYYINVTTAVLSSDFQRALMHIYENYTSPGTWTFIDTLDLTSSSDFYQGSLAANNYVEMRFEVNATNTAGPYNFDIQLRYW